MMKTLLKLIDELFSSNEHVNFNNNILDNINLSQEICVQKKFGCP